MENLKNKLIISRQMNLGDTRRRKILEIFQNDDKYRNAKIAIGRTEEQFIYLDKSYTATRRERSRYENNWTLSIKGQGHVPGPMKQREDHPHAVTNSSESPNSTKTM